MFVNTLLGKNVYAGLVHHTGFVTEGDRVVRIRELFRTVVKIIALITGMDTKNGYFEKVYNKKRLIKSYYFRLRIAEQ